VIRTHLWPSIVTIGHNSDEKRYHVYPLLLLTAVTFNLCQ